MFCLLAVVMRKIYSLCWSPLFARCAQCHSRHMNAIPSNISTALSKYAGRIFDSNVPLHRTTRQKMTKSCCSVVFSSSHIDPPNLNESSEAYIMLEVVIGKSISHRKKKNTQNSPDFQPSHVLTTFYTYYSR